MLGAKVRKRQKEMGLVEFQKDLVRRADADGFAELRSSLVGDLEDPNHVGEHRVDDTVAYKL